MTHLPTGAWAASLTPLNEDLSVDTGALDAHVRWLFDEGAAGVVLLGTTGEANSFSLQERLDLIAHAGRSGLPKERIVIGTGCCAAPDTIALTRAALDAGFSTVLMLPPFYYTRVSDEGLFRSYVHVFEQVRDARLRVLIYDIPPMTGFPISTSLLARLHKAFPETVVGVKNSSGEWAAMKEAIEALPGFGVYVGSEQYFLPALRAGSPGCISANTNVLCRELSELAREWRRPRADALQEMATKRRLALQKFPTIPALKEILAQASGDPRWRRMRPPQVALDAAQAAELMTVASELQIRPALPRKL